MFIVEQLLRRQLPLVKLYLKKLKTNFKFMKIIIIISLIWFIIISTIFYLLPH